MAHVLAVKTDAVREEAVKLTVKKLLEADRKYVVLTGPTGSGKTESLAHYIVDVIEKGDKVLYITHLKLGKIALLEKLCRLGLDGITGYVHFSKRESCPLYHEESYEEVLVRCFLARIKNECPYYRKLSDVRASTLKLPGGVIMSPVNLPLVHHVWHVVGTEACPYYVLDKIVSKLNLLIVDVSCLLLPRVRRILFQYVDELTHVLVDEAHELFRPPRLVTVSVAELRHLARRARPVKTAAEILEKTAKLVEKLAKKHMPEAEDLMNVKVAEITEELDLGLTETEAAQTIEDIRRALGDEARDIELCIGKIALINRLVKTGVRKFVLWKEDDVYLAVTGRGIRSVFRELTARAKRVILSSATISSYELSHILDIETSKCRFIEIDVKMPRETYVIEEDLTYRNRDRARTILRRLLERIEGEKPVIVTVEDIYNRIRDVLPCHYKLVRRNTVEEAYEEARKARLYAGRRILVLSPYSIYSQSIDLVYPFETQKHLTVIALSDAAAKIDLEEAVHIYMIERGLAPKMKGMTASEKLEKARRVAVLLTVVREGIVRTLQTIGRLQRTPTQRLTVYLVGKHYKRFLQWYNYEKWYGPVKELKV